MSEKSKALKPILLYDHLPGILAGYPAILFAILAVLTVFPRTVIDDDLYLQLDAVKTAAVSQMEPESFAARKLGPDSDFEWLNRSEPLVSSHMLFWIGLSVMLVWYIAYRFNMPKGKFLLMFGLFGTFVGIPVVLELTGVFEPFKILSGLLGRLEPTVDAGAWAVMSMVFFFIWLGNFIYSRTHMKVRIDESGLTVNRLGGKGERFELIGLKTENEPLDYLELFLAGVGSLSLKTRMNKPIFTMKRVIGLYRIPWFPFFRGKLSRIEEILSYQGKVVSVGRDERLDFAEMSDGDDDGHDLDEVLDDSSGNDAGDEFDGTGSFNPSPDERGID